MKVSLVQPPVEDFYDTPIRTYPLSLAYLAGKLNGICDQSILDFRTGVKPVTIPDPHPFPELRPFHRENRKTPFSLFRRYSRYGASPAEIKTAIEEGKPDIVAISSLFTAYAEEALETARLVKEVDRGITVVLGGTHPTLFPERVLDRPYVDYVIRGEGETPLRELVLALSAGKTGDLKAVNGLCFREQGFAHIAPPNIETDIDILPARRLLDGDRYRIGEHRYTFFLTSRGCPFHCGFCGRPAVPYRMRSLKSIETELSDCLGLGIEAIDFEDDMLTLDRRFFGDVLDLFAGSGLTLSAMNGIYAGTVDEALLERMARAGFRRLNFSIVDTSPMVARKQRRSSPEHLLTLFPFLDASDFLVETHFIIGLPDQSPEDVLRTMILLMGRRLLLGPSIFYPAPGSSAFDELSSSHGWNQDFRICRSSAMWPANPLFPRETTYTFMKLVRFINYVKGMLDRSPGIKRMSDLMDDPSPTGIHPASKERDRRILTTLLMEKRFVFFDTRVQTFVDEPQDFDLIATFFEKARGSGIRGFKTMSSAVCDV